MTRTKQRNTKPDRSGPGIITTAHSTATTRANPSIKFAKKVILEIWNASEKHQQTKGISYDSALLPSLQQTHLHPYLSETKITIIQFYAPTADYEDEEAEQIYEKLERFIVKPTGTPGLDETRILRTQERFLEQTSANPPRDIPSTHRWQVCSPKNRCPTVVVRRSDWERKKEEQAMGDEIMDPCDKRIHQPGL
ncbi:hypothetical protein DPMN_029244 [Dreissena polymorpha]|uniref:Uncharacterized protein n=1 Tax=Dreissena polymorpha TaxID=45954 RepID=A0A9D4LYU5_DREPO|nr:hypothetical protein DPMN_029244 [Dreissena polymorpha]